MVNDGECKTEGYFVKTPSQSATMSVIMLYHIIIVSIAIL